MKNLPPQKWALGRIIKLHFGEDKRVRVFEVKIQSGVYKNDPYRKFVFYLLMYNFMYVLFHMCL